MDLPRILSQHRNFLALSGVLIELTLLGMLLSGDLMENRERFLFFYFLAFGVYLFVAVRFRDTVSNLPVILLFALLFRLTLFFTYPSLTVDIYRYFWDGKVLAHGFNPYLYLPSSEALAPLRGEYYSNLVYKHVTTIYPPFAQLVFALSYLTYPSLYTLKAASVLFDLASLLVLIKILEFKGINKNRVLLYAWNPLVIVEFASSGHADSLAVFFVLLAYYLHLQQKSFASGAALGLAVLSKLYPVLLVPFFFKKNFKILPGFLAVLVLMYLPFIDAGWKLFGGLEVFLKYAKFNPGAFYLLEYSLGFPVAKYVATGLVALGYLFLLRSNSTLRSCYLILTLYLLLSPMVHPWYLAWVLSLVPLLRGYAWVAFSGLIGFSYLLIVKTPQTTFWQENPLITLVQYLPFYIILLWEEVLKRRSKI
jgi:hypothetical protein